MVIAGRSISGHAFPGLVPSLYPLPFLCSLSVLFLSLHYLPFISVYPVPTLPFPCAPFLSFPCAPSISFSCAPFRSFPFLVLRFTSALSTSNTKDQPRCVYIHAYILYVCVCMCMYVYIYKSVCVHCTHTYIHTYILYICIYCVYYVCVCVYRSWAPSSTSPQNTEDETGYL